jgi:hypothetical protein
VKRILQCGLLFLIISAVSCSIFSSSANKATNIEKTIIATQVKDINIIEPVKYKYKVSDETAINDIVTTWTNRFNEAGASKDDSRRNNFYMYAKAIVEVLRYYQNPEFKDLRQYSMPDTRYTHILIAEMIYRETSVDHTVMAKSSRKEVGLIQVHGIALKGHTRAEVRRDYKLGIYLGIDWLAHMISECNMEADDIVNPKDWLGPLCVYGAGAKRAIKNGHCITSMKFAKERVNKSRELMLRILANV